MPIFKQKNNLVYFIHIPRTGGRHVSSLFENSADIECYHSKVNESFFNGIDVTHLHYPLYNECFGVENIPHITIVRNPYKKFLSTARVVSFLRNIDYNKIITDEKKFLDILNKEFTIFCNKSNWFMPQHYFVSPNTHVWKYEWGFGKNFKNWVFKKCKIDISSNLYDITYEKLDAELNDTIYKFNLNRKIRKYVKKFYARDYKQFGYLW